MAVTGTMRVESETAADARAHLEFLDVLVNETSSEIVVSTEQPQHNRGRNYVVHYTIVIPEDLELEINNVNGGVTIREIDGSVSVANVNGQVRLDDVEGDASVVVVNGQIDAEARTVAGTLDLATTNGAIELDVRTNVSATFDAAVVNGTITVSNLTLSNPVQTTNSLRGTFGGGQGPAS